MKKENNVYGIIELKTFLGIWNASFDGGPKSLTDGDIFGSDKSLKYSIRNYWHKNNKKVLYYKQIGKVIDKKNNVDLKPLSLKEKYESIFECNLKDHNKEDIYRNLFKAIDVKNFGATFAEEKSNLSITGALQFGQGINLYKYTNVEEQQILSPFRDGTKDEASQSTLGSMKFVNEAHYFYPFCLNPSQYDDYIKLGFTDGYTEQDYQEFKMAALIGVTQLNSAAKYNTENEFALFIEVKKETYLPNLVDFITFDKESKEEKGIIKLEFSDLLNDLEENIISVEIYYNPNSLEIEHSIKSEVKKYNIFTRKEI